MNIDKMIEKLDELVSKGYTNQRDTGIMKLVLLAGKEPTIGAFTQAKAVSAVLAEFEVKIDATRQVIDDLERRVEALEKNGRNGNEDKLYPPMPPLSAQDKRDINPDTITISRRVAEEWEADNNEETWEALDMEIKKGLAKC